MTRYLGLDRQVVDRWHRDRQIPVVPPSRLDDWIKLSRATRDRIKRCEGQWAGQTVVCVGNGPSINTMDLRCLNGAKVIGTNRAFMLLDRFTPEAFHLVIQDNQRVRELGSDLAKLDCPIHIGNIYYDDRGIPPDWIKKGKRNLSVYLPRLNWSIDSDEMLPIPDFEPGFSDDPSRYVCFGFSVIFSAIQFAAYFGAKRIACIGIDMDYTSGTNFVPGVNVTWDGFSYEFHAKPMFELLHQTLQKSGIELINATPGGKVDAIPRLSLEEALGRHPSGIAA